MIFRNELKWKFIKTISFAIIIDVAQTKIEMKSKENKSKIIEK